MSNICFGLTGEIAAKNVSTKNAKLADFFSTKNAKLVDFGLKNQTIKIEKDGVMLKLNAFGVTANTYYSFVNIYTFFHTFIDAVKVHSHNMAI